MIIPTKASGLIWAVLAGLAAFAPRAVVRAGDEPRNESPGRLDAPALARLIDKAVQERLTAEKAKAAPVADDAEFVRRVYLDITGVIPPADKVVAFLDSTQPNKR